MKIKYLGHSSFSFTADSGTAIVCDPYEASVGFSMPPVTAHAVTLSHHHFDHDYIEAVSGCPTVFDKAGNYTVRDISISGIKSFHDNQGGISRGENVIFKYSIDGIIICHLGDLGEDISPGLIEKIGNVNVLLLPVGGTYTIDALTAKKYVDAIKPNIVIPMHYRTEKCAIDIAGIDGFLSLNKGNTIKKSANEICLSRDDICGLMCKIIVLERE